MFFFFFFFNDPATTEIYTLSLHDALPIYPRVNRLHHWLCRSARWRKTIEQRVPWVLSDANLGQDVLELGPGPGVTTDLVRVSAPHLTAIELDPQLANSLRARLSGSNVEVVTGDATAMPFSDGQFSGGVSFTM